MRKPGRPTKFTKEVQEKLLEGARRGYTIRAYCAYAGITQSCYYRWSKRKEKKFRKFFKLLKIAEGEAEAVVFERIMSASAQQWQAAAWILERRYPEDYGRKTKTDLTSNSPVHIVVDLSDLENEEQ